MQVPLEITFRNVRESPSIRRLVAEKAAQLQKVCSHLSSCRVAIELPHQRHRTGNRYWVRIDLTVPPSHELAVSR
jgi:ribosome-associated translation inhibitor RaiA